MHMPRLTGLETLRRVKQFNAIVPCILMSANADQCLVEQAMQAQAFAVLSKPVTQRTITATVAQAFERAYSWTPPTAAIPNRPTFAASSTVSCSAAIIKRVIAAIIKLRISGDISG